MENNRRVIIRSFERRRTNVLGVTALLLGLTCGHVSASTSLAQPTPRPALKSQRADEAYGFLVDPLRRTDRFDPLKYVPIQDGSSAYLTFAASARFRYNYDRPDLFGIGPAKSREGGILLERYLASVDAHYNDQVRGFVEVGKHIAVEDGFPAGANDRDDWDISQAFIDVSMPIAAAEARARIGRQNITLGSSRLVALRDGPNVRERFDGGRATFTVAQNSFELIGLRDVSTSLGAFDDRSNNGDKLWGLYSVFQRPFDGHLNVDAYYLGLSRSRAHYSRVSGNERRHSFGVRLWGQQQEWDWNWETVGQSGTIGDADIAAWTVASITGYTVKSLFWAPRLFVSANIASGGSTTGDTTLRTFNPLFPKLAYFEEASFLSPQNFINMQPGFELNPTADLKVTLDWNRFWRESISDAVYVRGLRPLAGTASAKGALVGDIGTINTVWHAGHHVTLEGGFSYFLVGHVIDQAGGQDSIFGYTALTMAF